MLPPTPRPTIIETACTLTSSSRELQSGRPERWDFYTGTGHGSTGGTLVGDLLYATGVYSAVESIVWQSVLQDTCDAAAAAGAAAPLVIDGGANIGQHFMFALVIALRYPLHAGYFSLLALAHGCRVVAFEPQQRMLPFIASSLHFNSFDPEHLALVPCALSDTDSGPEDCLLANEHPNWGEWSLVQSQVESSFSSLNQYVMSLEQEAAASPVLAAISPYPYLSMLCIR